MRKKNRRESDLTEKEQRELREVALKRLAKLDQAPDSAQPPSSVAGERGTPAKG